MFKKFLRSLRSEFFAQKYRFDLGIQFLTFVNFALLVVTASDKLQQFLGIKHTGELLLALIPLAFLGVWVFGYFMDKTVKMQAQAEEQLGRRSPLWGKTFDELEAVRKDLKDIKEQLKRRGRP